MTIEIALKNYRCFGDEPVTFCVEPGITAFVGANNAGKSALLRFFYDFRTLLSRHVNPRALEQSCISSRGDQTTMLTGRKPEAAWRAYFHDRNNRDCEISIAVLEPSGDGYQATARCIRGSEGDGRMTLSRREHGKTKVLGTPAQSQLSEQGPWAWACDTLAPAFADLGNTVLIGSFRNALNLERKGEEYFDTKVGRELVDYWRQLKTGTDPEQARHAKRAERMIADLLALGPLELNSSADGSTLQLIVEGDRRYNLGDMGAGCAHLVAALVNVASQRPAYVLIDEPETGLHPALQQRFVECLQAIALKGVLFATHSVGLARSTAERLYSVQRSAEGSRVRRFEGIPSLASFMGEMSFAAYRDVGYDTLLMVEGPSDLPVLRHFLRLMQKDGRVVLLPLRGDEGIAGHTERELDEVKRICPKVAALIDSERPAADRALDAKRQQFSAQCDKAGIPCHVLERRSIENYFTDAAVKRVLGKGARALGPYETREDGGWVALSHSKRVHNPLIAEAMTLDDLGGDLREFLGRV